MKKSRQLLSFIAAIYLSIVTISCGDDNGGGTMQPENLPPIIFIADKDSAGVYELFISSRAGASVQKLSGTLIAGGGVVDFRVSPDGNRVAFVANKDLLNKFELYVVSLNGGAPLKVSGDPVSGMAGSGIKEVVIGADPGKRWFDWAPDGSRIAYIADQDTAGIYELFSVQPNGIGNSRLSDDLVPGGGVISFAWAPNSIRIAYLANQDTALADELYTSPPDRSDNPNPVISQLPNDTRDVFDFKWAPNSELIAYRANQNNITITNLYVASPLGIVSNPVSSITIDGRMVEDDYAWAPDSNKIAYRANKNSAINIDLYSNPINPIIAASSRISGPFNPALTPTQNVTKFAWSPNSVFVAYLANQDNVNIIELYSASWNQDFGGVKVSDNFSTVGEIFDFTWSTDSLQIAYTANKDDVSVAELFTTSFDQIKEIKISGNMVTGAAGVFDFLWAPDNSLVAYRADEDSPGSVELFTAPTTGSIVYKISGPLVSGGNVTDFKWEPAADGVVYRADQITNGIFELFVSLPEGSANVNVSGAPFNGSEVLPTDKLFDGYEWVP